MNITILQCLQETGDLEELQLSLKLAWIYFLNLSYLKFRLAVILLVFLTKDSANQARFIASSGHTLTQAHIKHKIAEL